ncbi:MAG: DUF3382 domain-containing protein, partial [Alphaproteobacteria bacterium]
MIAAADGPSTGVAAILRDAGLAALVTFALALPLVGFETVDVSGGGLGLNFRFGAVAVAVVAVAAGRAAHGLGAAGRASIVLANAARVAAGGAVGPWSEQTLSWLAAVAAAVVALRAAAALRRRIPQLAARPPISADLRRRIRRAAPAALLAQGIAFHFLPITDQRLLDIAILV